MATNLEVVDVIVKMVAMVLRNLLLFHSLEDCPCLYTIEVLCIHMNKFKFFHIFTWLYGCNYPFNATMEFHKLDVR